MSNVIRRHTPSQICIWPNSSHVPVCLSWLFPPQNIKSVSSSGEKKGCCDLKVDTGNNSKRQIECQIAKETFLYLFMAIQIILLGVSCGCLFNMWHLNKCVHEDSPRLYRMFGRSMNVTAASSSVHTVGRKHWNIHWDKRERWSKDESQHIIDMRDRSPFDLEWEIHFKELFMIIYDSYSSCMWLSNAILHLKTIQNIVHLLKWHYNPCGNI